jgi:hypothetical protein
MLTTSSSVIEISFSCPTYAAFQGNLLGWRSKLHRDQVSANTYPFFVPTIYGCFCSWTLLQTVITRLLITSSMKVISLVSEDELQNVECCTLCFYVTSPPPPTPKKDCFKLYWYLVPALCIWALCSFGFILYFLNTFSLHFRNGSFGYERPGWFRILEWFPFIYISARNINSYPELQNVFRRNFVSDVYEKLCGAFNFVLCLSNVNSIIFYWIWGSHSVGYEEHWLLGYDAV